MYTLLPTPPFMYAFIPALAVLRGQELRLPHLSMSSVAKHHPTHGQVHVKYKFTE